MGDKVASACVCACFLWCRQGWTGVYTPWAYVPRMVCGCRCLITAYLHKETQGFSANAASRPMHMCFAGHCGHAFALFQGAQREGRAPFVSLGARSCWPSASWKATRRPRECHVAYQPYLLFRCTLGRVIGLWHTGAQEILSSARGGQRKLVAAPPS